MNHKFYILEIFPTLMETKILEEIGLEQEEAKIYLALLKLGPVSASDVSRETKIERTAVYRILEKLLDKGIANYFTENKVKRFNAVDPRKLLFQLEERYAEFEKMVPELERLSNWEKPEGPRIEIYRGLKGIKAMIREIRIIREDYCVLVSEIKIPELNYMFEHLMRILDEEGIKEKILVKEGFEVKYKSKNTEIRYFPKEYAVQSTVGVGGNKVGMIISIDPFVGIGIESEELAKTYKSNFDMLWKKAKKKS